MELFERNEESLVSEKKSFERKFDFVWDGKQKLLIFGRIFQKQSLCAWFLRRLNFRYSLLFNFKIN